MWRRMRNIIRAFLGLFIRMAEDPKLMLEQYIDDVRARIPTLRATAANVIATELKLVSYPRRLGRTQEVAFQPPLGAGLNQPIAKV